MKKLRRSLSLTPKDRAKLRTSLYEDTYPADPPEVGEYPVKGNAELPEHMRRHPYSDRTSRAPAPTVKSTAAALPRAPGLQTSPRDIQAIQGAEPGTDFVQSSESRQLTAPSAERTRSEQRGGSELRSGPTASQEAMPHGDSRLSAGLSDMPLARDNGMSLNVSMMKGKIADKL